MKKNQKGFTLMEMLIVVAVIAILVAVAIPVMNAQMHKVRVRTDWANVRAYYAEIQTDYMLTGVKNDKVKDVNSAVGSYDSKNLIFLDGQTVSMKAGNVWVTFHVGKDEGKGYNITYQCDDNHPECNLTLG